MNRRRFLVTAGATCVAGRIYAEPKEALSTDFADEMAAFLCGQNPLVEHIVCAPVARLALGPAHIDRHGAAHRIGLARGGGVCGAAKRRGDCCGCHNLPVSPLLGACQLVSAQAYPLSFTVTAVMPR